MRRLITQKILHGESFSAPFATSPGPVPAKILRFVQATTYTFRELKNAFLRRYALFSTLNPCYSKTAQCGILGPILEFTLKNRIVPALNSDLWYRKRRSRDLYFDFFPNFWFSGEPRIMINELDGKRRIAFPDFYALNLAS